MEVKRLNGPLASLYDSRLKYMGDVVLAVDTVNL